MTTPADHERRALLEPGLYRATVRGVPDQIVMLTDSSFNDPWISLTGGDNDRWCRQEHITDAHPLIVLDLENPAAVVRSLRKATENSENLPYLDQVAASIEAQTKPPRIEEPGLWGVVEASFSADFGRLYWVRDKYGWVTHGGTTIEWGNLIDPTLIREGVES